MKHRAPTRSESVQHKMYVTALDHGSTGFYSILIVLTVSSQPTMPSVRPLNHPTFLQGRKAFWAGWPCLHCDMPAWTMLSHPGIQRVMVRLLIRNERDEPRKVVGVDGPAEERGCHPIIQTRPGHEHGQHQAQRIDHQRSFAPLDLLAAILPPLGIAHLGGLDGLTINAHGAGRELASCSHTRPLAQDPDYLGLCPLLAPRDKGVIDGTLRQQIMWHHIPLAATAVQVEQCMQDFPQVYLPRAPSLCVLLGGWDHRFHNRPLLVRQI